jgi:hypothetical protein
MKWLIGLLLVVAFSVFILVLRANAHDPARPELDNWFKELRAKGGNLCCSDNDGNVVKNVDWESKDGHYRVRIMDKWLLVPDSAVVRGPNLDGRTMVWLWWSNGSPAVSCFMPGTMT